MAKQEQHDMREYAIVTDNLNVATAAMGFIPIPASGQVIRCINTVIGVADTDITFQLANVNLLSGGATATLVLPTAGSAGGDIEVIEFDPLDPINLALEGVDGEGLADGGTLELISDAAGTGNVVFAIVIAP